MFSMVSSATTSVFDIGCHLATGPDAPHPFYQRTLLIAFSPLLGTAMCILVTVLGRLFNLFKPCRKCIDKSSRKRFVVSWLLMLFLAHPVITQTCFKMFTCRKLSPLDTNEFLDSDATLPCYTQSYFAWIIGLGIPVLLLFSIGIPLLAFFILWRKRKVLSDQETKEV